jgi:hypothetical protein
VSADVPAVPDSASLARVAKGTWSTCAIYLSSKTPLSAETRNSSAAGPYCLQGMPLELRAPREEPGTSQVHRKLGTVWPDSQSLRAARASAELPGMPEGCHQGQTPAVTQAARPGLLWMPEDISGRPASLPAADSSIANSALQRLLTCGAVMILPGLAADYDPDCQAAVSAAGRSTNTLSRQHLREGNRMLVIQMGDACGYKAFLTALSLPCSRCLQVWSAVEAVQRWRSSFWPCGLSYHSIIAYEGTCDLIRTSFVQSIRLQAKGCLG